MAKIYVTIDDGGGPDRVAAFTRRNLAINHVVIACTKAGQHDIPSRTSLNGELAANGSVGVFNKHGRRLFTIDQIEVV